MKFKVSEQRTQNYISQLKSSFIFKALAISISFLIIPLQIKYLGIEQYGVWSTLLSIVSWVVLFDIGVGNGLRNKISESLAKQDTQVAQNYISTAYIVIGCISITLFILFFIISFFIPWQIIFNTLLLSNEEFIMTLNITVFFLFINFWLSLINQVFNGLQKTSMVVFNQFFSNFLVLFVVWILYNFFNTSILKLAFFYGFSSMISNLMISIWFYKNNSTLRPRIKFYSNQYIKSIASVGIQFFIIQIAVVVVFTTDKILITQLFGPSHVAGYDVVFKLFSVITIIHNILIAPLWSAYSDAYYRGDIEWIQVTIKNQLKIFMLIVIATVLLIFLAKPIIALWIGKDFIVEPTLVIVMAFFILISTWNNIFAYFINAIEELKIQINTSIIAMILNIPLSIFFVKYFSLGVYGIVLATCLSLLLFALFGSIQTWKILKGKDK